MRKNLIYFLYLYKGYALTSYDLNENQPVIGFDMGGTSTDVSRYAGKYEHGIWNFE